MPRRKQWKNIECFNNFGRKWCACLGRISPASRAAIQSTGRLFVGLSRRLDTSIGSSLIWIFRRENLFHFYLFSIFLKIGLNSNLIDSSWKCFCYFDFFKEFVCLLFAPTAAALPGQVKKKSEIDPLLSLSQHVDFDFTGLRQLIQSLSLKLKSHILQDSHSAAIYCKWWARQGKKSPINQNDWPVVNF